MSRYKQSGGRAGLLSHSEVLQYYLRKRSTIHPKNRYPAIIPTIIPTHFPIFPLPYPYSCNTPVPRIIHCSAKSVWYIQ